MFWKRVVTRKPMDYKLHPAARITLKEGRSFSTDKPKSKLLPTITKHMPGSGVEPGAKLNQEVITEALIECKTAAVKSPLLGPASAMRSLIGESAAILESSKSSYTSPYSVECPPTAIIIHNRSADARNLAITKLKKAWPDLTIIQVVEEGGNVVLGSDFTVEINQKKWSDMPHFKERFDILLERNAALSKSMEEGLVAFYPVWSAAAESAEWLKEAETAGFKWVGATKLEALEKIQYKQLCRKLSIQTSPFEELVSPKDAHDKDEALRVMAKSLVEKYEKSSELKGKPVFVKHNMGGGGKGTAKLSEVNFDNAMTALRKVVNEVGGHLDGIYIEAALDFAKSRLLQIEIEVDSGALAEGARLVWFNPERQKVGEVGFTDKAIVEEFLPPEVYKQCREASKKIAEATGYDGRGTNEMLILRDENGKWSVYALEFNKRLQVEHEAINQFMIDKQGRLRNVPAEQVMRSFGYPPPGPKDFKEDGTQVILHLRVSLPTVSKEGSSYSSGVEVDGAIYPEGTDILLVKGPVSLNADPKVGRILVRGESWDDAWEKASMLLNKFAIYGPKTSESNYFAFLQKLASNPKFRAKELGCNQTFDVLDDVPVDKGKSAKMLEALEGTVTPLITHGYRASEGVQDQPYPTDRQVAEFDGFMSELKTTSTPKTPFSAFLNHHDYERYIRDLKDHLYTHGGGSVTVSRDVFQSDIDSESALVQVYLALLGQKLFAATGMGVGFEEGGAQYQAGLMRGYCFMTVLLEGLLKNLPSHSLTRSKWLNGLKAKTPEEQAFYFDTIAKEVLNFYGLPSSISPFVPWEPYNFHAGNHPEQDVTTRLMLQAKLAAIPCWAWDPRYGRDQFKAWVVRQIFLFIEEGKPLHKIRIKNPGEGPSWCADVIVQMVEDIRATFKDFDLEDPIIYVHNHEFTGRSAYEAAKAFKILQSKGYHFLVVDSAPPKTSHVSNLELAKVLNMSPEQIECLHLYNRGHKMAFDLTRRFNNQPATGLFQDPDSEMAGGTNSSDFSDAKKFGIPFHEVSKAKKIGRDCTGMGTAVTPISEYIKQIGFAVWLDDGITDKTVAGVTAYIQGGGILNVAPEILSNIRDWKMILPRPELMEKLLQNHGMSIDSEKKPVSSESLFDRHSALCELQAKLPNTAVTDRELATVVGFDNIGSDFLARRDQRGHTEVPRDMTVMMHDPGFVHREFKRPGDALVLYGKKVIISKIATNSKTGLVDVEFRFDGHVIRTTGINPDKISDAAVKVIRRIKDKTTEAGSPMAGSRLTFFVKPGESVKAGQTVATIEAMKMAHAIAAVCDGEVEYLRPTESDEEIVEKDEVLVAFKPL